MLILSRRESEQICLGDDIVLTVVRVAGDKVRIGIEAPSNVIVLRDELDMSSAPSQNQSIPFTRAKIKPKQLPKRRAA